MAGISSFRLFERQRTSQSNDTMDCTGHSHDHDHGEGDDLGLSLRKYVDIPGVYCLNEEVPDSGKAVLKLHDERLTDTPNLLSPEDDPELLLFVPFTEPVTIQTITIRNSSTSQDTVSPRHVKLFTNRTDLDFDTARELEAHQELELVPTDHFVEGTVDYPCRPASKFRNITSIAIFVVDNYDDDGEAPTEVTYVGFKGKGSNIQLKVVETVYESRGMKKDHKSQEEYGARSVL